MILVDTGPIVAAAAVRDRHHERCVAMLANLREVPLLTPLVVAEVCYFLATRADAKAEAAFLRAIVGGIFRLVELTKADIERMAELVEQYASLPLGAADSSVIAVAERLNVDTVLTLDRRHFTVVRPRHVQSFTLPEA